MENLAPRRGIRIHDFLQLNNKYPEYRLDDKMHFIPRNFVRIKNVQANEVDDEFYRKQTFEHLMFGKIHWKFCRKIELITES